MSLFSGELGGAYYCRNFTFQNGLDSAIKNSLKHEDSSLKHLKIVTPKSPRAYIREDLSEAFLRLRLGGLIFGRAYFRRGLLSEFFGNS